MLSALTDEELEYILSQAKIARAKSYKIYSLIDRSLNNSFIELNVYEIRYLISLIEKSIHEIERSLL